MGQTLLETLSVKQLVIFCVCLFLATSTFFIIGGTKGADPATANIHICNLFNVQNDYKFNSSSSWKWYDVKKPEKGRGKSNEANGYTDKTFVELVRAQNGKSKPNNLECHMEFNAKLGYSDSIEPPEEESGWKLLDSVNNIVRPLTCHFNAFGHMEKGDVDGYYRCEDQFLFELGSVSHKHYIINLQFPATDLNKECLVTQVGHYLNEVHLTEIHQNGGYTISLFVSKTIMFPFILAALVFFMRRIKRENREKVLIEKAAIFLGGSYLLLVLPIDWFSLVADLPFMLFFSDLRQGLFYTALLIFWCIFAGEHIMDQNQRNQLSSYKIEITSITLGCLSLFIFDCVERGMQLKNSFHTIWKKDAGETAARVFIGFALAAALVFFLFFMRLIYHVYSNIRMRMVALPAMQEDRRRFYENKIYRFRVLIWVTLFTVAATVICFIMDQINETSWKFEDNSINEYLIVSSAMHFGMFGLWGAYVFAILILYSPSGCSGAGPDVQYRRSEHLLQSDDNTAENEDEVNFLHPKT